MDTSHDKYRQLHSWEAGSSPKPITQRRWPRSAVFAAVTAAAVLLTSCSNPPNTSRAVREETTTNAATATPTPTPIAGTACASPQSQEELAGLTFVCTADAAGALIWLEASESERFTAKLAKAAAAKAAAETAAAEKAAADKAAAEKAAADAAAAEAARAEEERAAAEKAAAEKAAADAAATEAARAAEAKAAQEAAVKAAPPAPQYIAPAAPPAPSGCDPNYSGCVPIASDVDCAGGSGNGPAYVQGPVRVIGEDKYELDGKDNDGIGCE
ncbi:hypothetical protein P2Q66_06955 [Arthrobacter sp. Cr_A7]|nr:hypothetical protein [Arthrobacter sp. Cr_A7]MDF2049670.1 hypothetical protein [Arthrobacter sp. Cr_A7]